MNRHHCQLRERDTYTPATAGFPRGPHYFVCEASPISPGQGTQRTRPQRTRPQRARTQAQTVRGSNRPTFLSYMYFMYHKVYLPAERRLYGHVRSNTQSHVETTWPGQPPTQWATRWATCAQLSLAPCPPCVLLTVTNLQSRASASWASGHGLLSPVPVLSVESSCRCVRNDKHPERRLLAGDNKTKRYP